MELARKVHWGNLVAGGQISIDGKRIANFRRDFNFHFAFACVVRCEQNDNIFHGQLVLPFADTFLYCPAYFQIMHLNTLLAQVAAPAAGATGQPQQPAWLGFAPMILLVIVFYFILIRPQQKRAKALAALVSSIKTGDKVATAAGIIGTVITVKDKTVTLRSADTKMEVTKASVTEILDSGSSAPEA